MSNNRLEEINQRLSDISDNVLKLSNERYKLNEEKRELDKEESKQNIGVCFKRIGEDGNISYFKIVDISEEEMVMRGNNKFDSSLYPTVRFKYPYNKDKTPFEIVDLRVYKSRIGMSGYYDTGKYEEISNEEYVKYFNEVNNEWIKFIEKLGK